MFQSSNPTLSNNPFETAASQTQGGDVMTAQGAMSKAGLLFGMLMATASLSWFLYNPQAPGMALVLGIAGLVIGLIAGLVIYFKPATAPIAAPVYALSEGLFLGAISAFINGLVFTNASGKLVSYSGIVPAAVGITFGVFALMLGLYKARIIRPTAMFVTFMTVAIASICLIYLVNIVLVLIMGSGIPYINGSGPIGIAFSCIVITIAALSLILDFGLIEEGENAGAPKYMEWYGAYALMTSLVWLYLEILKLLMKLRER